MSEELERFRRSLTAPIDSREALDAFDLAALEALEPSERSEAERLLTERLRTENDPRVPAALERLATTSAVEALRARLATAPEPMRVAVARALWHLAHDSAAADVLTEGLKSGDDQSRMAAARGLEELEGEPFDRALLGAIDDPYWLVKLNAISALWGKHRLQQWSGRLHRYPNLLRVRCMSGCPSVRRPAIAELDQTLQLLRAGIQPAALGWSLDSDVPEAVQKLLDSLNAPDEKIDLEAFSRLGVGEEREFGEVSLLLRAEQGDKRAVEALESIRTSRLLAALHELAHSKLDGAEGARLALARMKPLD